MLLRVGQAVVFDRIAFLSTRAVYSHWPARMRLLLLATTAFVAVHVLVTNSFLIPLFALLGAAPLRAPVVEEGIKLLIIVKLAMPTKIGGIHASLLLTGLAAGIGETIVNLVFRLDGLFAVLGSALGKDYTPALLYLSALAVFVIKSVVATIGHTVTCYSAIRLIDRRNHVAAYLMMVATHFLLNCMISGAVP